jgi:cytochrome c553
MIHIYVKVFLLILTLLLLSDCQKKYSVETLTVQYQTNTEKVKLGKRLAISVCGPCHYNPDLQNLSGKQMHDIPCSVGDVFASNITNHPEKGIGSYSPGELKYLLKTGITRDGRFAPYMMKPNIAEDDLENLIAFLKSDDTLVQASTYSPGATKYSVLGKFALRKIFHPLPYSSEVKVRPSAYDTVALGKYLVDINGCYECHSANMIKTDRLIPQNSKGYLGGGSKIKSGNGQTIRTPNLTFDQTGLKDWSEEDFSKALTKGITPYGTALSYPMPDYSSLTETEITAIYQYLKVVAPIRNKVEKRSTSNQSKKITGKTIYEKYSCGNCHGATGKGIANLTNAHLKYNSDEIKRKIETPSDGVSMPSFEGLIKDEEMDLLVKYVIELGKKSTRLQANKY